MSKEFLRHSWRQCSVACSVLTSVQHWTHRHNHRLLASDVHTGLTSSNGIAYKCVDDSEDLAASISSSLQPDLTASHPITGWFSVTRVGNANLTLWHFTEIRELQCSETASCKLWTKTERERGRRFHVPTGVHNTYMRQRDFNKTYNTPLL
jgi:hypothetical protein